MFTKISRPTVEAIEAVIQSTHSKKSYGTTPDAIDDLRAEPLKGALVNMMEAHVTSLDAIVRGFANAGALHF
jgi:hypothetical protein